MFEIAVGNTQFLYIIIKMW